MGDLPLTMNSGPTSKHVKTEASPEAHTCPCSLRNGLHPPSAQGSSPHSPGTLPPHLGPKPPWPATPSDEALDQGPVVLPTSGPRPGYLLLMHFHRVTDKLSSSLTATCLGSPRGRRRAHAKPIVKPAMQPVEKQKPEDPQISKEPSTEPPSSEQKLSLQPEPTVTFLLTLLSTSEPTGPKDLDSDLEIQEYRFLDQEDWGPQRTSKEIRHLQNDCMRLRESLSSTQMDNLALGEKLQNLPTLLYQSLKEGAQAIQEEVEVIQEEVKAIQEEAQALFQHPSSQNVALLLMPPDQPHDQRDKSQPWLGPRPESSLLGRLYHQLVPL